MPIFPPPIESQRVIELGYRTDESPAARAIVACIGLLAVIFGVIEVVLLPLAVLYKARFEASSPQAQTSWFVFNRFLTFAVSPGLAICETIGGICCLRRLAFGKKLLTGWAWAKIIWAGYGIAVNSWYALFLPTSKYAFSVRVISFAYELERWLTSLILPMLVILFLRQASISEAFGEQQISSVEKK
jgi:hypothetical protein